MKSIESYNGLKSIKSKIICDNLTFYIFFWSLWIQKTPESSSGFGSVLFDTDPDPGCKKFRYGSGSRANFDTVPDPGKKIRIRIQQKRIKYQENLYNVILKNAHIPCFVCLNNHLN